MERYKLEAPTTNIREKLYGASSKEIFRAGQESADKTSAELRWDLYGSFHYNPRFRIGAWILRPLRIANP